MSENSFRNSLYDQIYQESIGQILKLLKIYSPINTNYQNLFLTMKPKLFYNLDPKINMVRSFIPTKINY